MLSYMGRVNFSFFPKTCIQRTNLLRLSNSKSPSKGKRFLLTSYNVNDVIKRARDNNGNVTLMALGAKQDFILHFTTKLMFQSCFPVNFSSQPILIPNKNTHELRNNVNPTSKKLKFSRVLDF